MSSANYDQVDSDSNHDDNYYYHYESMLEEANDNVDYNDSEHDRYKPSPLFQGDYRCFPLSFIDKGDRDVGNKIILPANDLAPIIENQIPMPLQFEIRNLSKSKVSHCGVYEFSGHDDGVAFVPDWMMENMQLKGGDFMYVKNTNLEKGTYIKLQPHGSDFLEISNPKALLERNLQKFSCLTKGDTIVVVNGSKRFRINIVETKPDDAISIIDTDIEVEFAPPLDYKEPVKPTVPDKKPKFKPFIGVGRKLGEEPCSDLAAASAARSPLVLLARAAERKIEAAEPKDISSSTSQPRNKRKELTGENVEAGKKPKFQPFTGKKYTLGG